MRKVLTELTAIDIRAAYDAAVAQARGPPACGNATASEREAAGNCQAPGTVAGTLCQ